MTNDSQIVKGCLVMNSFTISDIFVITLQCPGVTQDRRRGAPGLCANIIARDEDNRHNNSAVSGAAAAARAGSICQNTPASNLKTQRVPIYYEYQASQTRPVTRNQY